MFLILLIVAQLTYIVSISTPDYSETAYRDTGETQKTSRLSDDYAVREVFFRLHCSCRTDS
jgi:hypothetical protein